MTTPIQAIIFDFGGVLLEWDPHALYRNFFDQPQQIDQFLAEVNFAAWTEGVPLRKGLQNFRANFPIALS